MFDLSCSNKLSLFTFLPLIYTKGFPFPNTAIPLEVVTIPGKRPKTSLALPTFSRIVPFMAVTKASPSTRVIGLRNATSTPSRFVTADESVTDNGVFNSALIIWSLYPTREIFNNPFDTFERLNFPSSSVVTPVTNEESLALSKATFAKDIGCCLLSTTLP